MIFFYEVGYSSYEECPIRVICHSKQFTTEEFDEMVLDCYISTSKVSEGNWNDVHTKIDGEDESNDYPPHLVYKYTPSVSNLYSDVVIMLLTTYGFTEPKITSSFVISDTDAIVQHDYIDFRETYCDKLKLLRQRFNVIEPRDNKIDDILNG